MVFPSTRGGRSDAAETLLGPRFDKSNLKIECFAMAFQPLPECTAFYDESSKTAHLPYHIRELAADRQNQTGKIDRRVHGVQKVPKTIITKAASI
jgi:hypothetical protein